MTTVVDEDFSEALQQGCDSLGISLGKDQHNRLLDYLDLLVKWNKAYNLSAIRDPQQMLSRHLLDSLSLVPVLNQLKLNELLAQSSSSQHWIDVGTGAGLPGIPLAIVFPQISMTLLDSNGKKTRFLFQVASELALDNVTVVQSRVESWQPPQPFDLVFSRAYATLGDIHASCQHLTGPHGRFLAMKGRYPADEISQLPPDCRVLAEYPLQVPGTDADRHLLVLGSQRKES